MNERQELANRAKAPRMVRLYESDIARHMRLPEKMRDDKKLANLARHRDWWQALLDKAAG